MMGNKKKEQWNVTWEDFSAADYCEMKCEFYNTCKGNRESCTKKTILDSFETLTEIEQLTLKLGFGFCDNKQFSLDEIAEVLDLTYERVRQIVSKALRKLNHPSRHKAKACLEGLDCYKLLTSEVWS